MVDGGSSTTAQTGLMRRDGGPTGRRGGQIRNYMWPEVHSICHPVITYFEVVTSIGPTSKLETILVA